MGEEGIERVLVVAAHPDDVDFGAGATVAGWTAAGIEVSYCIITDGDAGGFDPAVPRSDIAGIRRAEQEAAAALLGVGDVRFLGYPDGRLTVSLELRRDLARVIRQVRPQRVVCSSYRRHLDRIGASHPDHLAAGEATLCAVYPDARNDFAFPELAAEGLGGHIVTEVWMVGDPEPDTFVDSTEHHGAKVAALHCHASQLPDPGAIDGRILEWGRAVAEAAGLAAGRTAEAFRLVRTA